jgi:MoxR-like ATPase
MPTFTVQRGYDKRSEINIPEGVMIVGRETDCDVALDSGNVSRHHARITMHNNRAMIEDLNSANGTFVNSAPIAKPTQLKHMDVVQVGGNVFVYNDTDVSDEVQKRGPQAGQLTSEYYTFDFLGIIIRKIEENIGRVFKGKPEVIRNVLLCLFADGHLLIEDAPGVGKSMLAQALAKSIQGTYKRIQFTPDMLPSDVTGVSIYDESKKEFNFLPGPIFGNIILADEINRTTPRTQSALLECMSESMITIDGNPHVLPKPFFVVATQNPSDYHGTYPLPEPQLDRFLMRINIGYPSMTAEREILSSQMAKHPINDISYVVKAMEVVQAQALVRQVHVADPIRDYIVAIADATRRHPALAVGCSPRASLALMRMCQAMAAYHNRRYVLPRDVRELAIPVLAHRMTMKLRSQGEWDSPASVMNDIVSKIPVTEEEAGLAG